jgi:transposase InsO family protein
VHAQLAREGIRVGRKRVERLMAEGQLKGAYRSRYFRTTESDPRARVAPDLVHRDFHPPAPNRLWVADFTAIRIDGGFVFLAAVLDAFSRVAVGWSTLEVRTVELIDAALTMALQRRRLEPGHRWFTTATAAASTRPSPTASTCSMPAWCPAWGARATPTTTR